MKPLNTTQSGKTFRLQRKSGKDGEGAASSVHLNFPQKGTAFEGTLIPPERILIQSLRHFALQ
jgi:hypothetical protein